jgi:DNA-binding transcriptional regulator LsrR (DeoR family)
VYSTQDDIPMSKEPTTKVQSVIDMCSRKSGTTLADIAAKLQISKAAASSLIADARAKGVKVKFDVEGGRYYV